MTLSPEAKNVLKRIRDSFEEEMIEKSIEAADKIIPIEMSQGLKELFSIGTVLRINLEAMPPEIAKIVFKEPL